MIRLAAGNIDSDAFLVTPAVVVSLGRCECCETPGGVMISLEWLIWRLGIVIDWTPPH